MRLAALLQGTYYVLTGALPLASMDAFEAITGDKTDEWLVVMVALLTVAIGASLLLAVRRRTTAAHVVLALGSAASFAALDIWVVATGTGTIAYLGDLAVELLFIGLWSTGRRRSG